MFSTNLCETDITSTEEDEQKNNSNKISLFSTFYQILKGVYTSNLFETCFMVANDDLNGKTTHFTGFYNHTISGPKLLKPAQETQ